jgi:hypothetical protein
MDGVMMSDTESESVHAATAYAADAIDPLDPDATIRVRALDDVSVAASAKGEPGSELGDILRLLTPPAPADEVPPPARGARSTLPFALQRLIGAGRRLVMPFLQGLSRIEVGLRLRRIASQLSHRLVGLVRVLGLEHTARRHPASKVMRARMSKTEIAMLNAIAQAWGCSPSQVVRVLVLQQCRSLSASGNADLNLDLPPQDCASPKRSATPSSGEWIGVRRTLVLPADWLVSRHVHDE